MVFHFVLGMCIAHPKPSFMNLNRYSRFSTISGSISALLCFLTTLLHAHPGHYHPDETDEFDFLRSTFLHSHGAWDYFLIAVALASVATVFLSRRSSLRVGAIAMAVGALVLVPIL
jgi:hypothetical protein